MLENATTKAASPGASLDALNAAAPQTVNINVEHAVQRNKALGYSKELWRAIQEKVGLTGKDVDGIVGRVTTKAIAQKQPSLGFTGKDVDGICGPKTLAKLGLSKDGTQTPAPKDETTPKPEDPGSSEPVTPTVEVDVDAAKSWYGRQNYTKDCIKAIQTAVGFTDPADIDGSVGPKTIRKVAEWQAAHDLTADGKFGSKSAETAGITLEKKQVSSGGGGSSGGGYSYDGKAEELFGRKLGRTKGSDPESWVQQFLTTCSVKMHDKNGNKVEQNLRLHKGVVDKFVAAFNDIYDNYPSFHFLSAGNYYIGNYNYRTIKNPSKPNSQTLSTHSYGIAIDVNENLNGFYASGSDSDEKMRTNEHKVVKTFAKYGIGWGGRYGDYMHFSYFNGS